MPSRCRSVPLLLAVILLMLAGCSNVARSPASHEVQLGETLFSIAFHYGLDWREVARWNDIEPPYRIYVGQAVALIPPVRTGWKAPPVVDRPAPRDSAPRALRPEPPVQSLPDATLAKKTSRITNPTHSGASNWRWPTRGKVVTPFSPTNGKKGIDIQGSLGQAVFAAADGDVVYSGKGLIGYGNLVIIKHDDTWLSAYGHNRTLLVKEGDRVRSGDEIARMGQIGKSGSILHFEIRKNGIPVDPARYLPKQ